MNLYQMNAMADLLWAYVFRDRGFMDVQVVKDLSERDRFVRAIQGLI